VTPLKHNPIRIVRFPSIGPPVPNDVIPDDPAPAAEGPTFKRQPYIRRPQLGEILLDMGAISGSDLARSPILQRRLSARLGDGLIRRSVIHL